jgi:hypothetical protein
MLSVSNLLDTALLRGSKIEAIRDARSEGVEPFFGTWNGAYVTAAALPSGSGLKEAKDYVEALMEQGRDAPTVTLLSGRVQALEAALEQARQETFRQERRAERAERRLDVKEAELYSARERIAMLEKALTQHVLGESVLPAIGFTFAGDEPPMDD